MQAGADVNVVGSDSFTPLMLLVKSICVESIKPIQCCLKRGAQINLVNKEGSNAITLCLKVSNQYNKIPKLFKKQITNIVMLLQAAGETLDETKLQVPDYLKPQEFNLKHLCRETIRKHLINIDPHQHLFGRIPQLGLPSLVTEYLLYDVSLDADLDDPLT